MFDKVNNNKYYYSSHILNKKPKSSNRIRFEELSKKINMLKFNKPQKNQDLKNIENQKFNQVLYKKMNNKIINIKHSNKNNNGKKVNNIIDIYDKEFIDISLDDEKSTYTKIYTMIIDKFKNFENINIQNFLKNLEQLFKEEIGKINKCVEYNEPNFIYTTNVFNSQINIYFFFIKKYLDSVLKNTDVESSALLILIINNINKIFNKIIDMIYRLFYKTTIITEEYYSMKQKYNRINENNNISIDNVKNNEIENSNSQKNINNKKDELNEFSKFLTNKQKYDNYSSNKSSTSQTNKIIKNINSENCKNKKRNSDTYKNSSNHIQKIFAITYDYPEKFSKTYNNFRPKISKIKSKSSRNIPVHINTKINTSIHKSNSKNELKNSSEKINKINKIKEVIHNIYDSKESFDENCQINHQPKQTLKEFIYTYFQNKYGLKNLVVDYVKKLINGIKNYNKEDSEISLFDKILRNELEEECHLFMPLLKENIYNTLINIFREKFPYKSEKELKEIINKMQKSYIPLNIAQKIIYILYSEDEVKFLLKEINQDINNRKESLNMKDIINNFENNENFEQGKKLSRNELKKIFAEKEKEFNGIKYNILLDICHKFQIISREKYLKNFTELFKKVDNDQNGVISCEEFSSLIKNMNIFEQNEIDLIIKEYIDNIDPYNNDQITYSDCIMIFSFDDNGKVESVLDKLCFDRDKKGKDEN